jgi:hypothetical protein
VKRLDALALPTDFVSPAYPPHRRGPCGLPALSHEENESSVACMDTRIVKILIASGLAKQSQTQLDMSLCADFTRAKLRAIPGIRSHEPTSADAGEHH